jgi:hypothetical protein
LQRAAIIHAGIVKNLQEAQMVLCDVSSLNTNVLCEMGIRTALDKPIEFVRDLQTHHIPFDAAIMNFYTYDSLAKPLVAGIRNPQTWKTNIRDVDERSDGHNFLWKYFGLTQRG